MDVCAEADKSEHTQDVGALVANRYRIEAVLGRGAMGTVFQARDARTGGLIAVKRMLAASPESPASTSQFEREFHTLAGLKHPCIVSVVDYGVDESGPYYTMELLLGTSLHEVNRLPWHEVCELLRDVASALAMLHSRRLLHCDLSTRNVRCTTEGRGKLIDFGAMAPVGVRRRIVGTPPFLAPEALDQQALDARADLFSLGALAYRLITGRHAYPARSLRELPELWGAVVQSPADRDPAIPAPLSELVMQLISPDRCVRPASAAEVMERLCAIASLPLTERPEVTRAYLTLPALVGRERAILDIRELLSRAKQRDGAPLVIEGEPGLGCSRLLDVCVLEAKLFGATVLRAGAGEPGSSDYGVVKALASQLLQAFPNLGQKAAWLRQPAVPEAERRQHHAKVRDFFLAIPRSQQLVVAVDDFDRVDEPSQAILAALAHHCEHRALTLAVTLPPRPTSVPAKVVQGIARRLELALLTEEQTETLVRSVFGDADNAVIVARHLHQGSRGNPRMAVEMAQDLIDRRLARYEAGSWLLPNKFDPSELPDAGTKARLAALSQTARDLIECLAQADLEALALAEYPKLSDMDSARVFRALDELVAAGILLPDAEGYVFSRGSFRESIDCEVDPAKRRVLHERLAKIAEQAQDPVRLARHLLEAGQTDRAVEVVRANRRNPAFAASRRTIDLLDRLVRVADKLALPRARRIEITLLLAFHSSILGDIERFSRHAPALLIELKKDSGLADWEDLAKEGVPESERLALALSRAEKRYTDTPLSERGLDIRKAIAQLARLSVSFSSMSAITMDAKSLLALPSFLPFAALSPALTLLERSLATSKEFMTLHPNRAREHARSVLDELSAPDRAGLDETSTRSLRFGLLYMLGAMDAVEGIPDAAKHLAEFEDTPGYRATAWKVRRVAHMMQGDFDRALECQRTAELFDLEDGLEQAFPNTAMRIEACARWMVGDLVGLKQVTEHIQDLAAIAPGWTNTLRVTRSHYKRLQGDAESAMAEILPALESSSLGSDPDWSWVVAAHVSALTALGRTEEAATLGLEYHAAGERAELGAANRWMVVPMCDALVKCGRVEEAVRILENHIRDLETAGARGLWLGLAYEGRAYAAIALGDEAAFNEYAARCAQEYRRSKNSALIASYDRLMRTANARSIAASVGLDVAEWTTMSGRPVERTSGATTVIDKIAACVDARERARSVLSSLLEPGGADSGYLYALRAGRLELVACSPDGAMPPSELTERMERYVHDQLTEEAYTMTLHVDPATDPPEGTEAEPCQTLADRTRVEAETGVLHPLPLTTTVGGKHVVAAVAALASGSRCRAARAGGYFHACLAVGGAPRR